MMQTFGTQLQVTAKAVAKLLEFRGDDHAAAYVRVFVAGRTCCGFRYGLAFERRVDDLDAVVKLGGLTFAVDPESRPHCEGATIDYVETPRGEGFTVLQPGTEAGCACGSRQAG